VRSDLSRVNATHMPAGTPLTNLHTLTFLQSADDVPTPQRGCHMDILENTFYDSTVQSLFHMFSTKGAITTKEHSYQKDVHNAVLHHNLIIVENLSPVLSPQEREKQKQEITKSLYEVFKKYSDNHKSNRS
jgi:hypothetical protein